MIPILAAIANVVPWVAKYFHAGATVVETVGNAASGIVKAVGGSDDFKTALNNIAGNAEKVAQLNLEMQKVEAEWDLAYLKDVQNARDMQVRLAQAGQKDYLKYSLAALAYISMIIILILIWATPEMPEWIKAVLTTAIGRIWGWLDDIYSFEYGSTKNSRTKDDTINKLSSGGS